MNNIIIQLKNDQKRQSDDFHRDSIEEKSFEFLDSIIEVNRIFLLIWQFIYNCLSVFRIILNISEKNIIDYHKKKLNCAEYFAILRFHSRK